MAKKQDKGRNVPAHPPPWQSPAFSQTVDQDDVVDVHVLDVLGGGDVRAFAVVDVMLVKLR